MFLNYSLTLQLNFFYLWTLTRSKYLISFFVVLDCGDLSSSQPSPSLSTALPMDEEMTMRNAIINRKTGNMTMSKLNMNSVKSDEDDYQLIVIKKGEKSLNLDHESYKLPELLQVNNGYGLVTEVYVNNGYNYSSSPSSPGSSNNSSLERIPKFRQSPKPGCLLIEVEDCPDNYIKVEDSDSFEPDTLDRKPSKRKPSKEFDQRNQILLRTTGSFKNGSLCGEVDEIEGLKRNFGSLREIYEAKTKRAMNLMQKDSIVWHNDWDSEEGRLLTLEERHSKRQRKLNGDTCVPPDVIPPPPHDNSPIYEHPKPPRKVILASEDVSKNGVGRSTQKFPHEVSYQLFFF